MLKVFVFHWVACEQITKVNQILLFEINNSVYWVIMLNLNKKKICQKNKFY